MAAFRSASTSAALLLFAAGFARGLASSESEEEESESESELDELLLLEPEPELLELSELSSEDDDELEELLLASTLRFFAFGGATAGFSGWSSGSRSLSLMNAGLTCMPME